MDNVNTECEPKGECLIIEIRTEGLLKEGADLKKLKDQIGKIMRLRLIHRID